MRYYVPIVAHRQLNYIVEARDENGARQAAIDRFNAGSCRPMNAAMSGRRLNGLAKLNQ